MNIIKSENKSNGIKLWYWLNLEKIYHIKFIKLFSLNYLRTLK